MPSLLTDVEGWVFGNDTGLSSLYLVEQLTGRLALHGPWRGQVHHPWDPSDFGRCERLLRQFPLLRLRMGELTDPTWVRFVARWDEIVATIESEVPDAFKTRNARGSAPLGYALIQSVIDG